MKKTIQIHLGGVSFTVEEDAFQKLNNYLDAIKKYFASYEGSAEIVEDIESRIAEKFYDTNKAGQAISMTDVDGVIKSMGTVADFEAVQEDEDLLQPNAAKPASTPLNIPDGNTNTANNPHTRYFRDGRRKVLGGVFSGFSHLINVDVVWLRIAFILIAILSLESGFGAFLLVSYFVLWAIMPVSNDFEENKAIRKLFRAVDNKALGGVAGGLATYLNVDIVIIRILFVLTAFVGVGILVYLIFWVVVPKASSLTQKMELSGQALTIENIDSNIKSQAFNSPKTESPIAKLLLAPFRILASFIGLFGVFVRPLGALIRIVAGVFLLFLGITIGISALVATAMFFGVITDGQFIHGQEFFNLFNKDLPPVTGIFGFLLMFIPAASLCIVGFSFITGKRYGSREFWLTSLGIWFVGIVGSTFMASNYAVNFKNQETAIEEQLLNRPRSILLLDESAEENSVDYNSDDFNFNTNVQISTSDDTNYRLIKRFKASGKSKSQALKNAKQLTYNFMQKDSALIFDDEFYISGVKKLRNQRLELELELPVGAKFKMTKRFAEHVLANRYDLSDKYGLEMEDLAKFTFVMKENDEYTCLDCPQLTEQEKVAAKNKDNDELTLGDFDFNPEGESQKVFAVPSFDEIEIGDAFQIIIEYGAKPSVQAYGSEENLKDLKVEVKGSMLHVGFSDIFKDRYGDIVLKITTDKLEIVNLSGKTKTKIQGFKDQNILDVNLSGASSLGINNEINTLKLHISGASQALLKGKINNIDADLSGKSQLDSRGISLQNAFINASGASQADIGKVTNKYTADASGGSEITKE